MKQLKTFDYWISIILILLFTLLTLIRRDNIFITGYFVAGGWQIISMIVHVWKGWFTTSGSARHIYHGIVFISIFTIPIGSFVILLFTAPVMAIYYTYICHHEVTVKMQRPMALLK
jgi:hypothetical protein